jgi:hypothetical protein
MGQCQSPCCTNITDGNRTHCGTCRSRKYRQADPVRYFLNNLRRSASKRDIEFTLDLESFRAWAVKVNFRFGGGCGPSADSVDRIKNQYGYHIWNIQKLSISQNSKKYHHYDKHGKRWKPIPTPTQF